MKPELLISYAIARKGSVSPDQVLQLAIYGQRMRGFGVKLLAAYLAAESFSRGQMTRDQCAAVLHEADDEIEAVSDAMFGEKWRERDTDRLHSVTTSDVYAPDSPPRFP